jgi:hypothetical protein
VDLAQLNVISLEMRCWNEKAIESAIHRVLHSHGWLILYTHDVSDTPTRYGTTPKMLDWALAASPRRGSKSCRCAKRCRWR